MPRAGGRKVYGFYICNLRMREAFEGRDASWYEGLLYGSLWHTADGGLTITLSYEIMTLHASF